MCKALFQKVQVLGYIYLQLFPIFELNVQLQLQSNLSITHHAKANHSHPKEKKVSENKEVKQLLLKSNIKQKSLFSFYSIFFPIFSLKSILLF